MRCSCPQEEVKQQQRHKAEQERDASDFDRRGGGA